jgi:hypothetical protein
MKVRHLFSLLLKKKRKKEEEKEKLPRKENLPTFPVAILYSPMFMHYFIQSTNFH